MSLMLAAPVSAVRSQETAHVGTNNECDFTEEDDAGYKTSMEELFRQSSAFSGTSHDRCSSCFTASMEKDLTAGEADIDNPEDCLRTGPRKTYCKFDPTANKCIAKTKKELDDLPCPGIAEYAEMKANAGRVQAIYSDLGRVCSALAEDGCAAHGGCKVVPPLGCVVEEPRPRALGEDGTADLHLLTNADNSICFFNTALITLFGGSNDLLPALEANLDFNLSSPRGECLLFTRTALIGIVRAMRNEIVLHESKYVLPMMSGVKAHCCNFFDDSEMNKVTSHLGSDDFSVLRYLLLPSLGVTWANVVMKYSDCAVAASLVACARPRVEAAALKEAPELLILNFEVTTNSGSLPADFNFYSEDSLEVDGATYDMWAGTAATEGHNMAWTVHRVRDESRFTLYNDVGTPGIKEDADINKGFQGVRSMSAQIKLVIFRRV